MLLWLGYTARGVVGGIRPLRTMLTYHFAFFSSACSVPSFTASLTVAVNTPPPNQYFGANAIG